MPLLVLLAARCAASPAPGPTPPRPTPLARLYPLPRLAAPEYGIQAFLWWHFNNKTGWRDVDLVRDLGFGWVKQQFSWRNVSGGPGGYDWFWPDGVVDLVESRGLKLLARLDGTPFWATADPALAERVTDTPPKDLALFGEYCGALAERYAGRIEAYEVWNEPNLAREWGNQPPDPAAYAEMLKVCYLAIKAADPRAIVISAGMAPTDEANPAIAMPDEAFYRALYEAGAAIYFDMLGVHAPGFGNPPERSSQEVLADPAWASRVWTFRHVEDIRALMAAYGDGDKQIAITEMGWTSDTTGNPVYSWYAVDEATRADYLVRAYQYAKANWSPWIGLMSMVYIADPEWTASHEQYWWAITRPTPPGEPAVLLPAYRALREMEK
ncbi:MAG: hypothetical protein IT318_25245 [Anaerolineales bacterium]|nr:hypothetical protein [Anaerolineales bacterium]